MKNGPLRLSKFTHIIDLDGVEGVSGVYNTLNLGVVFTHRRLKPALERFCQPAVVDSVAKQLPPDLREPFLVLAEELVKRNILVPPAYDEQGVLEVTSELLDRQRIRVLYLILTDECNFACRYCYIEGNLPEDYGFLRMTSETARRTLDFYAKHAQSEDEGRENTVIFYGGEPLINFEVLQSAVEYIEELVKQGALAGLPAMVLNTNASLVTPEIARWLAEKEVNVSVSLDGPEEPNNANRVYLSGEGTYQDTVRGFRLLQEAGVKASVSCTITEQTVDVLPEVFTWLVDTFNLKSMGFNLLLGTSAAPAGGRESYHIRASQALIECYRLARELGVHEDRMVRKVEAFVDGRVYPNDCAACGQQIVAAPDGQVGVCTAFLGTRRCFTDLAPTLDPYQHPIWCEWRRRSPLSMPQCTDCVALGICGGGCLHNAFLKGGSIWEVDSGFCIHAKATLDFLLRDLYEKTMEGRS